MAYFLFDIESNILINPDSDKKEEGGGIKQKVQS